MNIFALLRVRWANAKPVEQAIARSVWLFTLTVVTTILLGSLGTFYEGSFGDLGLYQWWMENQRYSGVLYGITVPWVYPFPAQLPMLLAHFIAPDGFLEAWIAVQTLFNLVAVLALADWGRSKRLVPAYFWLASLLAIGPVSISRLDGFTANLAILGLLFALKNRATVGAMLLTIGAAIKIWPLAGLLGLFAAARFRAQAFAASAVTATSLLVLGILLGGGGQLLSFLGNQEERGLQVESVLATPWLWMARFSQSQVDGTYYNETLNTWEVAGEGVAAVSRLANYGLLVALLVTAVLALLAARAGAEPRELVLTTALVAVFDLIVFNKVGSPQFATWYAAVIAVYLLFQAPRWRLFAALSLISNLLTFAVYPVNYWSIIDGEVSGLILITVRNLLLVCLLVLANQQLLRLRGRRQKDAGARLAEQ